MNTKQNTPINIPKLIASYARVYKKFENVQDDETSPLQNSAGKDHKTGVIGEYYAYMYLKHQGLKPKYPDSVGHGDITTKDGQKYQVKTVSYYSDSKRLSDIHKGSDIHKRWDMLIVIELDDSFKPTEFFEISAQEFEKHYKYNTKGVKRGIDLKGRSKNSFVGRYKECSKLDELKKVPQLEL